MVRGGRGGGGGGGRVILINIGLYKGYIGFYRGYIGIMKRKLLQWGYIGAYAICHVATFHDGWQRMRNPRLM